MSPRQPTYQQYWHRHDEAANSQEHREDEARVIPAEVAETSVNQEQGLG